MDNHNINVATRGNTYSINETEFLIDVILPVKHGSLISKLLQNVRNSLAQESLQQEDTIILYAGTEFLNLLEDNPRFKNDVITLLSSLTNANDNTKLSQLNNEELLELVIFIIQENKDYFLGKLANVTKATTKILKAIKPTSLANTSNS